jgi:hypothetical protein
MKNIALTLALTSLLGFSFISCEREYDKPPVQTIPEGNIINIQTLKGMFNGVPLKITEDYSIYGVVTTDQTSGNFYKEAYFQDASDAINLRFSSSVSFIQGDSIRLYLKGALITQFNGVFQVDSLDPDKNIIIQANNVPVAPLVLTIPQASTGQAKLVQFNNVEFVASALGQTWANGTTQQSKNLTLTDCDGNTIIVRTSGFSNFADDVIPEGNGTFIGIVGMFGTTVQMYVRNPNELTLNGQRCGACITLDSFNQDFTNSTIGATANGDCWETSSTLGAPQWVIGDIAGDKNATASLSGTSISGSQVMWLVSPEINYNASNSLSFQSAVQNYNHDGLEVYVLTNYSGNPNTSTQTLVTGGTIAGAASPNNSMVVSGNIPLSGFGISGTYRIAFKYTGNPSASQTSTYKVDNIVITQ